MSNRETKKIKTLKGNEVELKTYLTGGESKQIQEIFFRSADIETGKAELKNMKAIAYLEVEKKAVELLVVSLNGDATKVVERCLDLPADEYQFIANEALSVFNSSFLEQKK